MNFKPSSNPVNHSVIATISPERFGSYLKAAGHDQVVAFELYVWNAHMGEAFYTPLQAAEIALRNRIDICLRANFGEHWWRSEAFLLLIAADKRRAIRTVEKRVLKRELPLVTAQIVAGLSFGFWIEVLKPHFAIVSWNETFSEIFPHVPGGESQETLLEKVISIVELRNRISHHEPIFQRDLSKDYATVMTLLKWMCPSTHDWIKPHCRVPAVLRQKPKPRPSSRRTETARHP